MTCRYCSPVKLSLLLLLTNTRSSGHANPNPPTLATLPSRIGPVFLGASCLPPTAAAESNGPRQKDQARALADDPICCCLYDFNPFGKLDDSAELRYMRTKL